MSDNVAEAKAALRLKLIGNRTAERSILTESDFANRLLELIDSLGVKRIGCYLSFGSEPRTEQFLKLAAKAGLEILAPKIANPNSIAFAPLTGELRKSALGFWEPNQPAILDPQLDLLIIPAMAVDTVGNRLGRGGGYFDRFLSEATAPVAAVVFEDEVLEKLPTEPHDMPVNYAVTQKRIIRFR